MENMEEYRSSTWGKIFTGFIIFIFFLELIGLLGVLNGKDYNFNGVYLHFSSTKGRIATGLVIVQALMSIASLIYLWKHKEWLTTHPAQKLSVFLVAGGLVSAAEYLIRYEAKIKNVIPMAWIFHVVIYLLYLLAPACRPYRLKKPTPFTSQI